MYPHIPKLLKNKKMKRAKTTNTAISYKTVQNLLSCACPFLCRRCLPLSCLLCCHRNCYLSLYTFCIHNLRIFLILQLIIKIASPTMKKGNVFISHTFPFSFNLLIIVQFLGGTKSSASYLQIFLNLEFVSFTTGILVPAPATHPPGHPIPSIR